MGGATGAGSEPPPCSTCRPPPPPQPRLVACFCLPSLACPVASRLVQQVGALSSPSLPTGTLHLRPRTAFHLIPRRSHRQQTKRPNGDNQSPLAVAAFCPTSTLCLCTLRAITHEIAGPRRARQGVPLYHLVAVATRSAASPLSERPLATRAHLDNGRPRTTSLSGSRTWRPLQTVEVPAASALIWAKTELRLNLLPRLLPLEHQTVEPSAPSRHPRVVPSTRPSTAAPREISLRPSAAGLRPRAVVETTMLRHRTPRLLAGL